jgi:Na+/glutamate symporter
MSQKDNFAGGFLAGAIVGGVVGGFLGTLLASRQKNNQVDEDDDILLESNEDISSRPKKNIEVARRSLEDQISQLNLAIDDVRQQLEAVNSDPLEEDSN